jgi:hypothetical protein
MKNMCAAFAVLFFTGSPVYAQVARVSPKDLVGTWEDPTRGPEFGYACYVFKADETGYFAAAGPGGKIVPVYHFSWGAGGVGFDRRGIAVNILQTEGAQLSFYGTLLNPMVLHLYRNKTLESGYVEWIKKK